MRKSITPTFIISFLMFGINSYSQPTEIVGKIKLKSYYPVYKLVTVPNCDKSYTVPAGTTEIKTEEKLTNGKTSITIENIKPATAGSIINLKTDKELEILIPPVDGEKASLFQDEKDKSKLFINSFLATRKTIKKGTKVREYKVVYKNCDKTPSFEQKTPRTLVMDEDYNYEKVPAASSKTKEEWFLHSGGIEVYDGSDNLEYYLVDCNNATDKYILKLENRIYIPYRTSSLYLTALTIPFKIRSGFTENDVEVKGDVTSGANIGVFGGIKVGRSYITNRAGTYTNASTWSIRVGPLFSLSAATLDSIGTTTGKEPMKKDDKQTIAVLSAGAGIAFEVKGFQMGFFGGWDFGTGTAARNWNYHKRFWLGVGVGYKLTDLFGQ